MKKITAIKIQLKNISLNEIHSNNNFEFHINKKSRDLYNFDLSLFSLSGNVIFANYSDVIKFAFLFNKDKEPEKRINPSYLNALGLVDEIYHFVFSLYNELINPNVLERVVSHLEKKLGQEDFDKLLVSFTQEFPPLDVYQSKITIDEYLKEKENKETSIQEIVLLYFANINPAFAKASELFLDINLRKNTVYEQLISELESYFKNEPPIGDENLSLFEFLKTPIINHPDDIEEQLKFISKKWGLILSPKYLERILVGINLVQEELKYFEAIKKKDGWVDSKETFVPVYKKGAGVIDGEAALPGQYPEYEKFTLDTDWMPKVVLIAKNVYVWLDQLSKKYNRAITKLNHIPDEELDLLKRWNITGLWLIGVWERSPASRKIKNYTGNPEAASSAYSLFDYEIAKDLGGEEAFQDLNSRAKYRGIRLACDMVPNHTGIYSKWIIERPDYYIQLRYPPFPNYSFTGPNLSDDPNIVIKIEDGYWSKRDAAVVFKREDVNTGDVRYIYHGNDGTNMPWNDTAQLDFLKQEVREAVIQQIFNVARKFSIIRFDAAMTLTKKHYQRLWYPVPGSPGDIPSRAGLGMKTEQFDALFPQEFWREVVDRFNAEMPNTLLLAEAFWLMEGYFVRTLGMHRVYNSAFMNMLMKEENSKYAELIKNTLEFNPEILKRYVNFLSNPDEETAIRQFGDGDKYFGVTTMMITMPGLPMFAHGQIEGYHEKYGMEYRKAYYNENPNYGLIQRHEIEVFPLLKKRYLFSQVDNFDFYTFYTDYGTIDDNVFAYSNMVGDERVLVFYHNKFAETSGRIKIAVPKAYSVINSDEKIIKVNNLCETLKLKSEDKYYYVFTDFRTNLEYIRSGKDLCEKGFHIYLKAYDYHIFMDFKEVYDAEGYYKILYDKLGDNPSTSIEEEIIEIKYTNAHNLFTNLINEFSILKISDLIFTKFNLKKSEEIIFNLNNDYKEFVNELISKGYKTAGDCQIFANDLRLILSFAKLLNQYYLRKIDEEQNQILSALNKLLNNSDINLPISVFKTFINFFFDCVIYDRKDLIKSELIADFRLDNAFMKYCERAGITHEVVNDILDFIRIEEKEIEFDTITTQRFLKNLEILFNNVEVKNIIKINSYQGTTYFNKEKFEQFIFDLVFYHIFAFAEIKIFTENFKDKSDITFNNTLRELVNLFDVNEIQIKQLIMIANEMMDLARDTGFKYDEMRSELRKRRMKSENIL